MFSHATLFDGKTATPYTVTLELHANQLHVHHSTKGLIIATSYSEIKILEQQDGVKPGIITLITQKKLRIIIHDPLLWEELRLKSQSNTQRLLANGTIEGALGILLVLAVIVTSVMIFAIPKLAKPLAHSIPEEWSNNLGANTKQEIIGHHKICQNPQGIKALENLVLHLTPLELQLTVINHPEINAVSLAGNRIIIFQGLIAKASSQEQLAGILAHEIAHVRLKHPEVTMIQQLGLSLFWAMLFGGELQTSKFLADMSYSRQLENEADEYARQLLLDAKINPQGLEDFFIILANHTNEGKQSWLKYLSSHPLSRDRAQKIQTEENMEIQYLLPLKLQEWQELKNICK